MSRALALERGARRGCEIYVKREDLSAPAHGGNKARKLEFSLAEAQARGAGTVLTGGGIGSNLALAIAIHCERLGLSSELVLFEHPRTPGIERHLERLEQTPARLHLVRGTSGLAASLTTRYLRARMAQLLRGGPRPFLLLPGASDPRSTLGCVDAALELVEQIQAGELPEPDAVFVAAGSCGTVAGLLVGLRLAGCRAELVAVRVAPALFCNEGVVLRLANRTLALLEALAGTTGTRRFQAGDLRMLHGFVGGGYAHETEPGREAVLQASEAGITLDGTYTGKAMAALLDEARSHESVGRRLLFVNTFDPRSHGIDEP